MKKFFTIGLLLAAHSLTAIAQSGNALTVRHLQELFAGSEKEVDQKTVYLMKRTKKFKSLVGKEICPLPTLRSADSTLTILRSHIVPVLNEKVTDKYVIAYTDILTVVKVKDTELTVTRNDEKIKIPSEYFHRFMLVADRDEMVNALEAKVRARKEAEEREAARAAEEARAALRANLDEYYESLKQMPSANNGPIALETKRDYDGTMPYWKKSSHGDINTYRDEKFVLNPRVFRMEYERNKDRSGREAERLFSLNSMQTDTFGLFKDNEFINLRTGEVIDGRGSEGPKLWESVTYLEYLKALPAVVYDGTESLNAFIGNFNTPYRERYLDAVIGERVFFLNDLSYDVITNYEESFGHHTTLYFQNHEPLREHDIKSMIIAVKWYEQLQKLIGKKIVHSHDIRYYGKDDTSNTWREELAKVDTYTLEKIEVKKGDFSIYLTRPEGLEREIAVGHGQCSLLAYPINIAEEWRKNALGEGRVIDSYLSYDAVLATTPKKPASVKKQDAEYEARMAKASEEYSELRNYKYIGTSLSSFLAKWPYAELLNTTVNGGVTVKVYYVEDYQLIFRNDKCVSQTKIR